MCKLHIMTEQAPEFGNSSGSGSGQLVVLIGILTTVICLVYLCLLDRAVVSTDRFSPIYRFLLIVYDFKTAWILAVATCLAAVWRNPKPALNLAQALGEHPAIAAAVAIVLFSLGSIFVYHSYPFSMDEYAAVFQSKIFSTGRLYAQLPPNYMDWLIVRGFNGGFLVGSHETGRVIEGYWPGFALILSLFEFLRLPWLCNATLAALALFLIHRLTVELTQDKRAAGWAILFALASGAFAANAISYYSMQAHMTLNLLFAYLLMRPSAFRAFGAGLAGSVALILHNPMPHTAFAMPWLLAFVVNRQQWRYVPPLVLGYAPGLALGLGWLMFRSDIASGAYDISAIRESARGAFTWPSAAIVNMRVASLVKMWVWACPCLFVFAALGFMRYRGSTPARLLGYSAAFTFVAYLFVTFDQGHGWGYRYFHPAWGVIPILAGCAMADGSKTHARLVSFAGAAAILGLIAIVPLQLFQIDQVILRHLALIGPPQRPGNNVYFIHPRGGFYVADMVQIDPLLRDLDLKLVSRGTDLDDQMIKRNWPSAEKVASEPAYDQWYLGPTDLRGSIGDSDSPRSFVLK